MQGRAEAHKIDQGDPSTLVEAWSPPRLADLSSVSLPQGDCVQTVSDA